MAAITKSSGKYFTDLDRVWEEARQTGVPPFLIGRWKGAVALPDPPTPEAMRPLFGGAVLPRVQHNRVGCYDVTFTASKSVSVVLFALTPPDQWRASGRVIADAARPELERLLAAQKINGGAGGATKSASEGVALGLLHSTSFAGMPHGHLHAAVPNVTVGADGRVGSVANAKEMFERQGVLRASFHKGLDEALQRRGFTTVRAGRVVDVVGVPAALVEAFSPARAAMNAARGAGGFSGPRAADFYARQARRAGPRAALKPPAARHAEWHRTASRFGVTRESLLAPGRPDIKDKVARAWATVATAQEALRECAKRYGTFSENQYRERLYTLAIGQPTTRAALDREAKRVLGHPEYCGVKTVMMMPGGEVRFTTGPGAAATRAAERPYVNEAFNELKQAAAAFGKAVLVKTAETGAALLRRVTDALTSEPPVLRLDARDADRFLAGHTPTHYLKAHAKALLKGLASAGNPHERAGVAEREYARQRAHARLPEGAVLVVDRGEYLSARQLRQLAAVAKRDGASVVLSRPGPDGHGRGAGKAFRHDHEQRL